ncbi:MAG TPA: hypothetical protein PLS11_17030 [Ottowia sp.]|nr:hypothetical protein [Ottowia sp.]
MSNKRKQLCFLMTRPKAHDLGLSAIDDGAAHHESAPVISSLSAAKVISSSKQVPALARQAQAAMLFDEAPSGA